MGYGKSEVPEMAAQLLLPFFGSVYSHMKECSRHVTIVVSFHSLLVPNLPKIVPSPLYGPGRTYAERQT